MPTVAITGANGFIGSKLVQFFSENGWEVRALARSPNEAFVRPRVSFCLYRLGYPIEEAVLKGVNVLIHAAHDFSGQCLNQLECARLLVREAQVAEVEGLIFLSSMSAHVDARSSYGRVKWEIENYFLSVNGICVRPGLVIGQGGLFGRLRKFTLKYPIIPLVSGGYQKIRFVSIDDLARSILDISCKSKPGLYIVASPTTIPFRDLMLALAVRSNGKKIMVRVPYSLAYLGLLLAEKLFPGVGLS
ncbi:MAG: NAD-dependent epimerase/dehydratase family protein, partial [Proteobacteria bacterium]